MLSVRSPHDRFRTLGWLAGIPVIGLILGVALPIATPRIEDRLTASANEVVRATTEGGAEPWLRMDARGRHLIAAGEAPNAALRDDALHRLAQIPGLRRLDARIGLVEEASPFVWSATRAPDGRIELDGQRPVDIGPVALAERLAPVLPPDAQLRDTAKAARGAPPDFAEASAYAVERLRALTAGGVATLRDTTLSLSGEAASVSDYESLQAALANPPPGFSVGKVEILPPRVDDFRFAVSRERNGRLVLSGHVVSEAERGHLRARAAEMSEGAGIEDSLQTATGLPASTAWSDLTRFAFQIVALLQDGRVTYSGGTLAIVGDAIDGQAVGEIRTLLRDGRPGGIGAGEVTLTAHPLSPYKVMLRRETDRVTISGHLPDQAARDRLAVLLRPRFFHERIVDKTRIALGAPADLSRVIETAITPLSILAKGEFVVTDRAVRLTGESLYPESAAQIEQSVPRQLPGGWTATVAIDAAGRVAALGSATCTAEFDRGTGGRSLRFAPGNAELKAEFYASLDALASVARRCPGGRIEVTGHADPAGTPPPRDVKPVPDAAVESTASIDPAKSPDPAKSADRAKSQDSGKAPKTPVGKSAAAKPVGTAGKTVTVPEKVSPAEASAPEPDLARQRALAIVEYLLKAGVAPDRAVAMSGQPQSTAQGVGLALRF